MQQENGMKNSIHDAHHMGDAYNVFADQFAKADMLPTWRWVGKEAMNRVLSPMLKPGVRFLDFGSASARVEVGVLMPAGVEPADMVGVEISPDQVEIARTRVPGAAFMVGDISDPTLLGDQNGSFDVVFSHMVFEHLDDHQFALTNQNTCRLLKEKGMYAFVVTHPDKMTDLDGNLVTTYGAFTTSAPWGGELTNFRRSVDSTIGMVESAGFRVEFTDEVNFPRTTPTDLSVEDAAVFTENQTKYHRYPAIRLLIRAYKTS
jgi:SAM-dependent methyltransferase